MVLSKEMEDITKIVMSLEDSSLLIKDVTQTIENKTREQSGCFLGILLGTFGTSLLGNMLASKGVIRDDNGVVQTGDGIFRSRWNF